MLASSATNYLMVARPLLVEYYGRYSKTVSICTNEDQECKESHCTFSRVFIVMEREEKEEEVEKVVKLFSPARYVPQIRVHY